MFDERQIDLLTGQERDGSITAVVSRGSSIDAEIQDRSMELKFVTSSGLICSVCCLPYEEMLRLSDLIRDAAIDYREQDEPVEVAIR